MKTILFLVLIIAAIKVNVFAQDTLYVTKTIDPDPFLYIYDYNDSLCDPVMLGTLQWAFRKRNDSPVEFCTNNIQYSW